MDKSTVYRRKPEEVHALQVGPGVTRMDIETFCAEHGVPLAKVNVGTPYGSRNTDDLRWVFILDTEFYLGDWIVFPIREASWTSVPHMHRVEDGAFSDLYEARP